MTSWTFQRWITISVEYTILEEKEKKKKDVCPQKNDTTSCNVPLKKWKKRKKEKMADCQSFVLTWSAEVIFNASNIIHEILYI